MVTNTVLDQKFFFLLSVVIMMYARAETNC